MSLTASDLPTTGIWYCAMRGSKPVAMFVSSDLAEEWKASATHRNNDRIKMVMVVGEEDLPPAAFNRAWRRANHLCERCGNPAEEYSPGNHSAKCEECNAKACVSRNAAAARRRAAR